MFDISQIQIDRTSDEPLHMQLVREFRRLIREMNQAEYESLPSERFLCSKLELNRRTVHKAFESLLSLGIVRRQSKKTLKPNISARKKLEGNLPAIGIVLPCRFSQYIGGREHAFQLLAGIFDRAAEQQYAVLLLELPPPKTTKKVRQEFLSSRFSGLTGVLLLGDRDYKSDPMLDDLLLYNGIPQVAIAGEVHYSHIGAVKCRFERAASDMADFFSSEGVKSIGIVSSPANRSCYTPFDYSSRHREEEMRNILDGHHFDLSATWHLDSDFTESMFPERLPDAFWCINDQYALRLLDVLKKRNPKEYPLICGFDGAIETPDIATIRQPYKRIGAQAVDMVIDHYKKGITPSNRVMFLEAEFIPPKNRSQQR